MQHITKEQFNKLEFKSMGRDGATKQTMKAIRALDIDQALVILKDDWPVSTPPINFIHQADRQNRSNRKYHTRTLDNGSGWAVIRIK